MSRIYASENNLLSLSPSSSSSAHILIDLALPLACRTLSASKLGSLVQYKFALKSVFLLGFQYFSSDDML